MKESLWLININSMMKKIIYLGMILFGIFSFSQTKQDKVKELISLSGAFPLSKKVEKELIDRYKKKYTNVPESEWKSIEKKINIDELVNKAIEIYGSKFSDKEIDGLLTFYKSDLGKKVIQNSPIILSEIQNEMSNWGSTVTETINADLVKLGYLKSPPPSKSEGPPPPMVTKK